MKFNPMKARCRATFAARETEEARFGAINEETEMLEGVQITLEGEALGHDVWLDRAFCEAVAEQGNAMGDAGVKVRFGHPAMCSDALGTYLGRAKNFRCVDVTRKDGKKACGVLADVYIAPESHKAPGGDLGAWVMEAAKNSPDTFGQSIVFTYADFKVIDAEGGEHFYSQEVFEMPEDDEKKEGEEEPKKLPLTPEQWEAQSADGHIYAVLGKLLGTDFTDTPAATDGVFSGESLAAQAEEFLAENPLVLDMLEKHPENVVEFLQREGMWGRIESKRCANLQAAKDKAFAEMKADLDAKIDALMAERAEREAALEALTATHDETVKALADATLKIDELTAKAVEDAEHFNAQLKESTQALESALAETSGVREELAKSEAALADTREQLDAEISRYRKLSGVALKPATEQSRADKWRAAYSAARKSKTQKKED